MRPTHQMRRTGNTPASPTTGSEACGGAGMTKWVALMKSISNGCADGTSGCCADRRDQGNDPGIALLQAEERSIATAPAQQIVMPTLLDDFAGLDHQDGVGMHDGVQPVGNHDGGAVLALMVDRLL